MPSQLNTGGSVTLDVTGAGTVYLSPALPGVTWVVNQVSCITSTNISGTTTFQFYYPSVADVYFQGGSYSGNQDTDTDINLVVFYGSQLIGVWAGGDSGAIATMSILGTFTAPGNP